jgi:two-component system sensor histidine kinase MprB
MRPFERASAPAAGNLSGAPTADRPAGSAVAGTDRPRRRLPVMTLRRRLVISFAGLVTIAVALVGGISYSATMATFNAEMDRALVSAATTIAAGGTVSTTEQQGQPDRGPAPRGSADPIISLVQHISPGGTVTVVSGAAGPLSPTADQLRLAADGPAGVGRFGQTAVDGATYRTYALAENGGTGAVLVGRNLADASRVLTRIAINTILIGLVVILAAALAGWWIARQITRRLTALSAAAEEVAQTGDLSVPVDGSGRDEVGRLAASMRSMLAQLGQSRDAQRRLVEDAGHELRTPITSLRTNARVLRRYDELPPADRSRLLDDVDSELRELTVLVNELVELATDTHPTEPAQPILVRVLLDRAAARIGRRTGRTITVTADETVLDIQPHAVERAVSNLLENAAKFDPDGTHPIEIDSRHGTITVSDRGPGVPPDDLDRIFDRFHRGESARSLPGSGLGLAIVRDVATRHGGSAGAAPRPGGGLIMTLALGPAMIRS